MMKYYNDPLLRWCPGSPDNYNLFKGKSNLDSTYIYEGCVRLELREINGKSQYCLDDFFCRSYPTKFFCELSNKHIYLKFFLKIYS